MGSHQVRLGAVPALACRGCRIVKSCEFWSRASTLRPIVPILVASGGPYRNPRRFPRDLFNFPWAVTFPLAFVTPALLCLAAAAAAGPSAAD
jgi:hypothetical protein